MDPVILVEKQQMKTHYDVLQLEKSCSAKEIRDSFIKLSKEYHPDRNKSSDAHAKFVEVNEAYSVLGNPCSRCNYDATLSHPRARVQYNTGCNTKAPYEYYSEMYANARRRNADNTNGYYTRSKIGAFILCCLVMAFGSGLQIIAESRRRAIRSQELAAILRDDRERFRRHGLRGRLEELKEASNKREYYRVKREQ